MRRLAILPFALALAACAPTIHTDVIRFHAVGLPERASFSIQPEGRQAGSLEFQKYAGLVAQSLVALGWQPAAPASEPDKVVHLAWGAGAPETESWASLGTWSGREDILATFPYWETHSITTSPLWLSVEMLDARVLKKGERNVVFEGRAIASRFGHDLPRAMPYLVKGLFSDFPGIDGKTVRVSIPAGPMAAKAD